MQSVRLVALLLVAVSVGWGELLLARPIRLAQAQSPPAGRPPAAASGALTGAVGETQTGLAAYYSHRLNGRRTASGERFNNAAMTTAHQTLPFGTMVKVTTVKTNRSVVLRVNDRGPTQAGRIVDVSRSAARRLGFIEAGLAEVKLEVVAAAKPRAARARATR